MDFCEMDCVLFTLKWAQVCLRLDIGDDKSINGHPKRTIGIYFNLYYDKVLLLDITLGATSQAFQKRSQDNKRFQYDFYSFSLNDLHTLVGIPV